MAAPSADQLFALKKLHEAAQGGHACSRAAANLLLGFYDGERFPFDLADLRRLEPRDCTSAFLVLQMDCQSEVGLHLHLAGVLGVNVLDVLTQLETWAHRWKRPGRCDEAELERLRGRSAALRGGPA